MLGFWCSLYQESTVVDIVSVNNISLVEVGDDTSVLANMCHTTGHSCHNTVLRIYVRIIHLCFSCM